MNQSNPFYATSASAMLLGCWLLSEALQLQAGQLQGLLVLMLVLQVYEALLQRPVDLVEPGPIRNPYFKQSVEASKVLLFEAA